MKYIEEIGLELEIAAINCNYWISVWKMEFILAQCSGVSGEKRMRVVTWGRQKISADFVTLKMK